MNSPSQPNLFVVRCLVKVADRDNPRPDEDEWVGEAFLCPTNPSRALKEFSEWNLNHRPKTQLLAFAEALEGAGEIRVRREPAGVNLFLHAGRG